MVPDQVGEGIASRRKGLGLRFNELAWRVRNRKTTALVNRIMAGSGKVFTASAGTAQNMLHLRRMAAEHLSDDPRWVRLDSGLSPGILVLDRNGYGIVMGPAMADLSPLDAARVFWENVQRAYDAEGYAKSRPTDRDQPLYLDEPTFEARLRAYRIGCDFFAAGLQLGMKHGAGNFGGTACADETPGRLRCYTSAAEAVSRRSRASLDSNPVPCAELERVSAGNPASLRSFKPRWSIPECIRQASLVVGAPGWRGSDKLCAEEEAKVNASGLFFIRPMK